MKNETSQYLIILTEPNPRKTARLVRLLLKHGVVVKNIIITIEIDKDSKHLGLLGGIRKNYHSFIYEGTILVPTPISNQI